MRHQAAVQVAPRRLAAGLASRHAQATTRGRDHGGRRRGGRRRVAFRDLARRSDEQVRGPKVLWRVLIGLNPGNSLAYWAFGRRAV